MAACSRLLLLVVAELSLMRGLHALAKVDGFGVDWLHPARWLREAPVEDIVGGVLLVGARLIACWLLASTVAYLVASLRGRAAVVAVLRRVTLPAIRGLANRVVAVSIAASAVSGPLVPAAASSSLPSSGVVWESRDQPLEEEGEGPELVLPPHLMVRLEEPVEGAPPPERPAEVSGAVVVARGDHLWSISQRHLETVWGRTDLGDNEVAGYWVQVIEANRDRIRSGNPDLIFPGEVILLPSISP